MSCSVVMLYSVLPVCTMYSVLCPHHTNWPHHVGTQPSGQRDHHLIKLALVLVNFLVNPVLDAVEIILEKKPVFSFQFRYLHLAPFFHDDKDKQIALVFKHFTWEKKVRQRHQAKLSKSSFQLAKLRVWGEISLSADT